MLFYSKNPKNLDTTNSFYGNIFLTYDVLSRHVAGIALACADGRIAGWIWARGTLLPLYCYYPVAALGALDRLTAHRRSGSPASCCMVGRTLLD